MHSNTHLTRSLVWPALCLSVLACGSSGDKAAGDTGAADDGGENCTMGELGCTCYPNATCNNPFVCSPTQICAQGQDVDGSPVSPTGGVGGTTVPVTMPGEGGTTSVIDASAGGGPSIDAPLGSGGTGGADGLDAPAVGGGSGTGGVLGAGGATPLDASVPLDTGPCSGPELACPCSTVGALNCVGHAQKGMMMCDGAKWVPNGACTGTLLCDTMPGPTQGTCVQPIANCANQQPGYSYCSGTNNKITCGPDLLTVSGEICPFVCAAGQCSGECTPSTLDCDGKTPLSCATNGTWLRGTTCTSDCNKGACCSTSAPNACNGTCVDLQTSNTNCGACGVPCSTAGGQSCRLGLCQCATGMTDCSGTCASLATSSANCGQCGLACEGGRTCQAGLCLCPSGTKECLGICANVQSDKANCGECGISCGDSICYGGTCGGDNLILNGDFADGGTYWNVTQYTTGVTFGTSGSAYCLSLPSYGYATLGWPDKLNPTLAVPIALGYGYTLSYTVSSTSPLYSFLAKVGHAVSPYTSVYSTTVDKPGTTATQFTHSFTSSYSDTGAGIAFTVEANSAATVCFDDVSLVLH